MGGLERVKRELSGVGSLRMRRTGRVNDGKLTGPQKGVVLYGPPGTGKTMLAKDIAKECGAVFINVKVSKLMRKWFGDAQKLGKSMMLSFLVYACLMLTYLH